MSAEPLIEPAAGAVRTRPGNFGRALTVSSLIVLLVIPVFWTGFYTASARTFGNLGFDLTNAYVPAAEDVLDGVSPYPAGLDDPSFETETAYVYPPFLAFAVTPLTALPDEAVIWVGFVSVLALFVGSFLVLGVRDWRCYGAALLWYPTGNGVQTMSASMLVLFGAALAWRWRATVWPLAVTLGLAVATKLFLWPLLVWTLATRRFLAAVLAALVAALAIFAPWAALGFEDIGEYAAILRHLSELEAERTFSIVAASSALGLDDTAARAAALLVGGMLAAASVVFARRGEDARSFVFAIAAALAFTPILWQHYLTLLIVPLAIVRPRFSFIWLLPIILWAVPLELSPRADEVHGFDRFLPALVTGAVVAFVLLRAGEADRDEARSGGTGPLAWENARG